MQQFQATTTEQSDHTPLAAYVPPDGVALTPEQATEASKAEQQAAAVEKLLAALESDTQKRLKWNKVVSNVYMACVFVFLLVWILTSLITKNGGWVSSYFAWINLVNLLGWFLGLLFLNKKAAAELAGMDDIRCVGTLVDIWGVQGNINYSKKTRAKAAGALTRLLPRLKTSDAALLTEAQRVMLRGVLQNKGYIGFGKYQDAAFMVSILRAFEQVGDWKSLPHVQKLAQDTKRPNVRAAAIECLPYLEALAEKQKPGENLLRASSASEAANMNSDKLLRPADATAEAQPETLLRASSD